MRYPHTFRLFRFLAAALLSASPPAGAQVLEHLSAEVADGAFASSVAMIDDLDGDGVVDILVGEQWDNTVDTQAGRVRIYSGRNGLHLLDLFGETSRDYFGCSVQAIGDFTGDGHPDFAVGAFGADDQGLRDVGMARVFSGQDGSEVTTHYGDTVFEYFGQSLGGAGDVNGDGRADLIVGAPGANNQYFTDPGSAVVFSGADDSVIWSVTGTGSQDRFGSSVAGAGDVNGDGLADFVVGAPYNDLAGLSAGWVRVFSGADGTVLHTFLGDASGDRFGWSVDGAGDVNSDGFDDLVVGAPQQFLGPGYARLFSGLDGSVLDTFVGDAATSPIGQLGKTVRGVGDVNSDGFDDVLVGGPFSHMNGNFSGVAKLFSGADGSVLHLFIGDGSCDNFGASLDGGYDANADGVPDVLVGAWGLCHPVGNRFGYARLFAGGAPFHLSDPAPGVTGVPNTISVEGAEPQSRVVFYGRPLSGASRVPCQGTRALVSLGNARMIGSDFADAAGVASMTKIPPALLSGMTFRVQAVEFQSCRFSNLVAFPFP